MKRKPPAKTVQRDLFGDPVEDPTSSRQDVIPLDFETHAVRMILIAGEPWWILADVARVLGYIRTADAARILKDKHKGAHQVRTPGGTQEMTVVSEAGLYRLMMRSDKPEAERFQDWITETVVPSIRRTGTYATASTSPRVQRTAKRLKCDLATAGKRVEVTDQNKHATARILGSGGGTYHLAAYHNGAYRGQFGMEAADLRRELGIRPMATPLDHMTMLPLMQNGHSKALAEVALRTRAEAGEPVPLREQAALVEEIAAEHKRADMARLGPRHAYAITEDPARGKVIDVVKFKTLGAVA